MMKLFRSKKALLLLAVAIFAVIVPPLWIVAVTGAKIHQWPDVPERRVGVVFGAAIRGKDPSHVFADRLQVAALLYRIGKIDKILVSGDNSRLEYNEPQIGKSFLLKQEIPAADIVLDYAGFRTFDTCARARRIFEVDSAILITQKFHLSRAIFLCEAEGIDSIGVPADLHRYAGIQRFWLREQAARWVAFWEATVFRHDPTVLGNSEPIR